MFTINDIRGQFNIEGGIRILKYHSDAEEGKEYEECYVQENGTSYNIPEELCDIPITFIYAEGNYLDIELEVVEE